MPQLTATGFERKNTQGHKQETDTAGEVTRFSFYLNKRHFNQLRMLLRRLNSLNLAPGRTFFEDLFQINDSSATVDAHTAEALFRDLLNLQEVANKLLRQKPELLTLYENLTNAFFIARNGGKVIIS